MSRDILRNVGVLREMNGVDVRLQLREGLGRVLAEVAREVVIFFDHF